MTSKTTIGLLSIILIVLSMQAYAAETFAVNNALMEKSVFAESSLQKMHPEVQNEVEESPDEIISVLIKSESYKEELKKAGTLGIQSVQSIQGKMAADKARIESKVVSSEGKIRLKTKDYIAVELPASKLKDVVSDPAVKNVYPDRVYRKLLDRSVGQINAPAFWNRNYRGKGIRIAILDTGIDSSHPMLVGKVVAERAFTGENHTYDVDGHGTHVAGIAAGRNNGQGFNGVAPDAALMNAKVMNDDGFGTTSGIIAGIEWAVDPDGNESTDDGADIISMSLGGAYSTPDTPYIDAIKYAISRGVVVVVSSGNCGSGCPSSSCGGYRGVTTPGNVKDVISVGAVDDGSSVACFSSGGDVPGVGIKPDVVAPGVGINSSFPGSYASMSGTSMSAPHVSGAVALILEKNTGYTPLQVKQALELTATDLGAAGKDVSYGSGLINLQRLLDFNINSLIEYDVSSPDVAEKGSGIRINVTIISDVAINSMIANITHPDSAASAVIFNSTGNRTYSAYFIDTEKEGRYSFRIIIDYGENYTSAYAGVFDVISHNRIMGRIKSMIHEPVHYSGRDFNVSAMFENTNDSELNVSVEMQLLKEGAIMSSYASGKVAIAPFSEHIFNLSWPVRVAPGNYSLRAVARYAQGFVTGDSEVYVGDNASPAFRNMSFSEGLSQDQPFILLLEFDDESRLNGSLSITAPDNANYSAWINEYGSASSNTKSLSATFPGTGSLGAYSFNFRVCDSFNNCFNSSISYFSVNECNKSAKVLLVKSSDSEFSGISNATYCVAEWRKEISKTPNQSYLKRFDAVVWSSGNSIEGISSDDASLLSFYSREGGRLFLEGSDIAFNHRNGDFLRNVTRSIFVDEIFYPVFYNRTAQIAGMRLTNQHQVTWGLNASLQLDASRSPFPDVLSPVSGGYELSVWHTNGSAIVVSDAGASSATNARTVFLPFSISALDNESRNMLVENAISWLTVKGNLADLTIKNITYGYLVEGNNSFNVTVANAGNRSEGRVLLSLYVDGILNRTLNADIAPLSESILELEINYLPKGTHSIRAVVNEGALVNESSYSNNAFTEQVVVAGRYADIAADELLFEEKTGLSGISFVVGNMGGSDALNVLAELRVDGFIAWSSRINLSKGETKRFSANKFVNKGQHTLELRTNADSTVTESDYANNNKTLHVHICSRSKILVVDDSDTESHSTEYPSTASSFREILEANDYCVAFWNESLKGTPAPDYVNGFDAIIWSAGNYWNTAVNETDIALLERVNKNILFEGADIAFDHNNDTFAQYILNAILDKDLLIDNNTKLLVSNHSIFENITSIEIDSSKGPYPDSLTPSEGLAAANWSNASAAIVVNEANTTRTVYFGFPISILNREAKEKLVLNTIQFLTPQSASYPSLQFASPTPENRSRGTSNSATVNVTVLDVETANGILDEGESGVYAMDGKNFEVIAEVVTPTDAKLSVNGASLPTLREGESYSLGNNSEVRVMEIMYQDFSGGKKFVSFNLSTNRIAGCILEWNGVNESMNFSYTSCFSSKATVDGESYSFRVYANSTAGLANATEMRAFRENSKPATGISIYPAAPHTKDNLNCTNSSLLTDVDNDTAIITAYDWSNGSWMGVNSPVLSSENTTKGQSWICSATISDGFENITATSDAITIQNSAPAILQLDNMSVHEGQMITVILNAADNDSDSLAYFTNDSRFVQDEKEGNIFRWGTAQGDAGAYSILFGASDGLDNASITVSLEVRMLKEMALTIQTPQNNSTTNSTVVWIAAITDAESTCYYSKSMCSEDWCTESLSQMFSVTNSTAHLQRINTTEEGNYTISVFCNNSESANMTEVRFRVIRAPYLAADLVLGNTSASHECNGTNITATLATQITNKAEQPLNFSIKWQLDNLSVETRETAATGTITRQQAMNTTAGNHTFRVKADSRLEINETDESNNAAEISFEINYTCAETGGNYSNTTINQTNTTTNQSNASSTLSDLLPTSIIPIIAGRSVLNSSDYYAGETIFFDTGIINLGGTNTGIFNIKWFVDGNMTGYGSHLGVQNMTTELNGNSQYTWTATAGQHNITFVVDADNHVSESNETNNRITYFLIVMETSPYVPLQDAMLNGRWLKKGSNYTTTDYGIGGHALIVLNNTLTTDGIITAQLKLPHQNAESGLCARINLSGYGYCLGTAWGGEQKLVISYFSGHPYAPEYISGVPLNTTHTILITLKIRLNGTNITGKAYNTGQPEPDWQIQAENNRFQTGNAAYYTYYSATEFHN